MGSATALPSESIVNANQELSSLIASCSLVKTLNLEEF
jgi:hypothetical protein